MSKTYRYFDPNANAGMGVNRTVVGESHQIIVFASCRDGLAIRINNEAGEQIYLSCYRPGTLTINNTPTVDSAIPCDCINGGCVPKDIYKTPGVFATLSACQAGCAKNSNCTGECVDPAEIAALNQALNNLQAKIC
jgi:hypothetical protein